MHYAEIIEYYLKESVVRGTLQEKSAIVYQMTAGFTFHCYVVLRRNVLHEDGEPYRCLSIGLFEKRCFIKNVYTQFRK